jgi:hypothetical protein
LRQPREAPLTALPSGLIDATVEKSDWWAGEKDAVSAPISGPLGCFACGDERF